MARYGLFITGNEKKVNSYCGVHSGKRAFIIGNGPSLTPSDLDLLKDEITFAANKIYLLYDQTIWRPTYYGVEDDLVLSQNFQEICQLKGPEKFLPINMLGYCPKVDDALYLNFRQESFYPDIPKVSNDAMKGLFWGSTIVYTLAQLAMFMGIKELYFIGMDFSFYVPEECINSEKVIVSTGEVNHFCKDYRKPGEKWSVPNTHLQQKAFEALRQFGEKNGVQIFNATRGGKLEALERRNLDEVMRG